MWTRRRLLQAGVALGISLLWPAFTYSPKSSLQAVRDSLAALRRQRLVLSPLEGLTEFRGVLHAHTSLSHDSRGTVEEIIAAARQARLRFGVRLPGASDCG